MNYFLPMLAVGLGISIHCVFMCGSMVLTYAVKDDTSGSFMQRMLPHAVYHACKLVSYMLVGLALGALGSVFDLGGIRGWVTIAAGLFMILLGLQMTGKFPALRKLSLRPPKFLMDALSRTRKKAAAEAKEGKVSLATPATFGLLTGLMPCGPLQSAQLSAAAAGSAANGAISMLGFGLGTAPLMLLFGVISTAISGRFKKYMMVAASVVIIVLGVVYLDRGAMLLGSPITAQSLKQQVMGTAPAPATGTTEFKTGADGVVEVPVVIENVQFVPQTVAIPADKPVRLVVDRREENPCSDQIAVPQLGILVNLAPNGTTTVDIPASKAGSYTLTCGMGMMAGSLQVGAGGAGGSAPNPLPLMLLAGAGLMGFAYWNSSRKAAAAAAAAATKGGSKGGSKGSSKGGSAAPAPAPAGGLFGFTPAETVVVVAGLVAAVIAGLAFGGMFQ